MENNIVLYKHTRIDTGVVFYIGIGNPERPYIKWNRNEHWKNIINKTEYKIDILFDNLSILQACLLERLFILLYGRLDLGTGTLVNMTDGGDGSFGLIHLEETKEKISKSLRGRTLSVGHKRKISKALISRVITEKT
jgi:hypothetical protein